MDYIFHETFDLGGDKCLLLFYKKGLVNKSVFKKFLLRIEKVVKIFLILNKTFSKNDILLCAL